MQTATEFLSDPQPTFRVGEKVHLGRFGKHDHDGFIGKLELIDPELDQAVVAVTNGHAMALIQGQASFLSKLH